MVVPLWRSLLQESLEKNSTEPALDFVQLGTVKPYGQPTNKIVQFQSFFNKNPIESNQKFVSMVMFFVDAKNDDVLDISNGSPYGEVCMFLPVTHEIYRLSGRLYIVSSPNNPIYQSTNYNNKIFTKMGYDMERERLHQWNECILPIHMDIPNKFDETKGEEEAEEEEKDNENDFTVSKSPDVFDVDKDNNFLSINPRTIMIDDYLNYHNLNKNTMIKRKESNYNLRSGSTTPTDSNLDANPRTESYKTGLEISKQMDFKPNQPYDQFHHHHHHHHHHHLHHNHTHDDSHSHSHSHSDSYHSDLSSKSEESNNNEYLHTYCNLCQQMGRNQQRRHRTYSLSIKDLRKEMMDNFCLLLLDVNKVYYSNYDYIPLKILEYTRTYSIQEEIMKNRSYDDNNPVYETYDNPLQMTLKNTYTSLNFENLKNIKFLHSNRLLDSAPLVSAPLTINGSNSKCLLHDSKSEKWNCSTVNYAFITN